MDLDSFQRLITPAGQAALREAEAQQPVEADFLQLFTQLSKKYPEALARAALETAILRREAAPKFSAAANMYFIREALEQASSETISTYRAARYRPFEQIVDLGCSLGGDTLALASISPTIGLDLDRLRLAIAKVNLDAAGLAGKASFVQSDLRDGIPLSGQPGVAIFFDPARRINHRRVHSTHKYQPPLEIVQQWVRNFPALGVKISPGANLDELQPYDAEIEFISLNGGLKEAVLWFGAIKTARRRATLLPGRQSLIEEDAWSGETSIQPNQRLPVTEPCEYIYEPDPAILRAGLVRLLGGQLAAAQLDPDIAYLTSDQCIDTPFARVWKVDVWFPFQLKRLRDALRQRHVGQVTIKKRGSPLQPEELIAQLRLSGSEQRVVFLTHLRGRPIVILAWPK